MEDKYNEKETTIIIPKGLAHYRLDLPTNE